MLSSPLVWQESYTVTMRNVSEDRDGRMTASSMSAFCNSEITLDLVVARFQLLTLTSKVKVLYFRLPGIPAVAHHLSPKSKGSHSFLYLSIHQTGNASQRIDILIFFVTESGSNSQAHSCERKDPLARNHLNTTS